MNNMRIIIIGSGIAGTTAAEEIRVRAPQAEITIIGAEQHPCYSRVLLPHYIKGKVARDKVFLKTLSWYAEKNIELMAGVRALAIDTRNKFVLTSEDRELPFDKLLITSGTDLDLLAADCRGVSYLSTIEDADHLLELISELKTLPGSKQRAFVYGSGFIACEYANIFNHYNIPFSMGMRGSGFWNKSLSAESQMVLARHLEDRGVIVYTHEAEPEIIVEKELKAIKLSNGQELDAALLGVGIGVRAEHGVAKAAGLAVNHGILANEALETSVSDVYTAGDVAEFKDVLVGRSIRYGNWLNALMQGRAVAKTMTDNRAEFSVVSSYATNLLGLNIVFIGDTERSAADEIIQVVNNKSEAEEIFVRDGKCVGAVLLGSVARRAEITKKIGLHYGA